MSVLAPGRVLGRPGVYRAPDPVDPTYRPVRLDVAGFVGVALRGPVDLPVRVTRWSDYVRRFGSFEPAPDCPERLLPWAVQSFFAQGGVEAYVLRVAPVDGAPGATSADATASYLLDLGAGSTRELSAADEGAWGSGLRITFDLEVRRSFRAAVTGRRLELPPGVAPGLRSLLRLSPPLRPQAAVFRWVVDLDRQAVVLDAGVASSQELDVAVLTGVLDVTDSAPGVERHERLAGLELGHAPDHPASVPCVLATGSTLLRAAGDWSAPLTPVDPLAGPVTARPVRPGLDRCAAIDGRSFFDDGAAAADSTGEVVHRGVDAMGECPHIGLLCVPDLGWKAPPAPPAPPVPVPVRSPGPCDVCWPEPSVAPDGPYPPTAELPPALDGRNPDELDEIVRRQLRVVQTAELRRRFVALLDVPAGLPAQALPRWRAAFDSSYAAAYHPWLGVPGTDPRHLLVRVPPSAFAAGITAARERRLGLPWGPANELAVGAVLAVDPMTDALHDQLHLLGVNVFRAERDGFRLTAARTLSSDPDYRQLSVRRLMTMIALTLDRQSQWLVFEPNTSELRERLRHTVTQFLRQLQRAQAFAGSTEAESFFVQCDDGVNPAQSQAEGRLVALVGVAPVSPLEYVVVRITQDADGSVQVSERP